MRQVSQHNLPRPRGGGNIPQNEHLTVIVHKPIKIGIIVGNGQLLHLPLPLLPFFDIVYCTERGHHEFLQWGIHLALHMRYQICFTSLFFLLAQYFGLQY